MQKTVAIHLNTFRRDSDGPILSALFENGVTPLCPAGSPALTEARLEQFTQRYKSQGYKVEVVRWTAADATERNLASDLVEDR